MTIIILDFLLGIVIFLGIKSSHTTINVIKTIISVILILPLAIKLIFGL